MQEIKRIRAKIITEAQSKGMSVMRASGALKESKGPYFKGAGNVSYLCKACGKPLVKEVEEGQYKNIVLECTNCSLLNLVA